MKFFITGGTGSLGSRLARRILSSDGNHSVVIFSRDEQKQYNMKRSLETNHKSQLQCIIGDVRDKNSVFQAMRHTNPDYVIHTAAQKHVRICDENPEQAVLTNINGTINVCESAEQNKVQTCCVVSTDKAVEPTTVYGMTKAIVEKIVNNRSRLLENTHSRTRFMGVRYGNVINSAGSLVPSYIENSQLPNPSFPLTNTNMTRFFITFDQAINWILSSMSLIDIKCIGPTPQLYERDGVFFVPKLPSAKIIDIASLFSEKYHGEITSFPIFPGEKVHESLTMGYDSSMSLINKQVLKQLLEEEGLLI